MEHPQVTTWPRTVVLPVYSGSKREEQYMTCTKYYEGKEGKRDFPGGPVVKNPPCNAGSIPGRGTKIPHAAGQLSPRAATTEPACLNERAHMPQIQSPGTLEPVRHN